MSEHREGQMEPAHGTRGEVTEALRAWRSGREEAEERLLRLLYPELHRMAERFLRGERPDHTLQPTALVHEAYLQLVDQRRVDWQSRRHFFAIAARVMRRILVDHARRHLRQKRGADRQRVLLEDLSGLGVERLPELVALDEALAALAKIDARKAEVVELRYFGGFTAEETAEILAISVPTVGRHWRVARAWLFRELYGK
ncbi:MAG TPA: sigma-70 family RNA polymerase sigma factor [Thermoanaerobaculia bacterium]|nr:sigma-70 family RNA polymerase sigma factor [Thermoanaerobaculia bacterium]